MRSIKDFFGAMTTDATQARHLVSLKISAVTTALASILLANQQFLLQLVDRVTGHEVRDGLVGVVVFLAFFVPALKCEYTPVPTLRVDPPSPPAPPPPSVLDHDDESQ